MIAVQAVLLATRLETLDEAKIILIYHVVGTVMEIFKTSVGSWMPGSETLSQERSPGPPNTSAFMLRMSPPGRYRAATRASRLIMSWIRGPTTPPFCLVSVVCCPTMGARLLSKASWKSSTWRFCSSPAGPGRNPPGVVGDWLKPCPSEVRLMKSNIVGTLPS